MIFSDICKYMCVYIYYAVALISTPLPSHVEGAHINKFIGLGLNLWYYPIVSLKLQLLLETTHGQ